MSNVLRTPVIVPFQFQLAHTVAHAAYTRGGTESAWLALIVSSWTCLSRVECDLPDSNASAEYIDDRVLLYSIEHVQEPVGLVAAQTTPTGKVMSEPTPLEESQCRTAKSFYVSLRGIAITSTGVHC